DARRHALSLRRRGQGRIRRLPQAAHGAASLRQCAERTQCPRSRPAAARLSVVFASRRGHQRRIAHHDHGGRSAGEPRVRRWRPTMSLEALIFDVDGTLADTEETHRQAFNDTFLRFDLKWDWTKPLYRGLLAISGGKERINYYIGTLALPLAERARLCQLVPSIHRVKTELYTQLIADGRCPLRRGVARLF